MYKVFLIPTLFIAFGTLSGQQEKYTRLTTHPEDDFALELKECHLFSGAYNREEDALTDYVQTGEIVLQPNDCCLNIQVGRAGSMDPDQTEYIYRLEGYSPNWFTCNRANIDFVSLPYGNFTLAIRAKKTDGLFSRQELRIPVKVLRPFYLKAWFLVLIAFAGIAGFLAFLQHWNISFTRRTAPNKPAALKKPPFAIHLADRQEDTLRSVPNLPAKNEVWLQQLEKLSVAHIGEHDFTVSHLAKLMLMGESNFYRQVQELTGLTPNQYLKEIRMNKARQLLETQPHISIKQLTYEIGMKDVKYFSIMFKQRFGKVPSEYV